MAIRTTAAGIILSAPESGVYAHSTTRAAAHVAGDVDRIFRFTDRGIVIGGIFLLALSFMLWVLWHFWRDSRR